MTTPVQIGDRITNINGVNATDIPIGATVMYYFGVDGRGVIFHVVKHGTRKILSIDSSDNCRQTSHGQNGIMEVLTLPIQ